MNRNYIICINVMTLCIAISLRIHNIVDYIQMLNTPEYKRELFMKNPKHTGPCFPDKSLQCFETTKCGNFVCRVSNINNPVRPCTLQDWKPVRVSDCNKLEDFINNAHPAVIFMIIGCIILFISCCCTVPEPITSPQSTSTTPSQPITPIQHLNKLHAPVCTHSICYIIVDIIAFAARYHALTTLLLFVSIFINSIGVYVCYTSPEQPRTQTQSVQQLPPSVPSVPSVSITSAVAPIQPITASTTTVQPNENTICLLCMDSQRNVLFGPCNHLCCCENCATITDICPVCRSNITYQINIFIP
jgi:hypothetical protein